MRHACVPCVAGIPPGIWNGANPPSVSPPLHVPFPLVRLPSPPPFLPSFYLPLCRQRRLHPAGLVAKPQRRRPAPLSLVRPCIVPFSLFLSLLSFIFVFLTSQFSVSVYLFIIFIVISMYLSLFISTYLYTFYHVNLSIVQ